MPLNEIIWENLVGFNEQLIRKVPLAHELCKALITAAAVLRLDLRFCLSAWMSVFMNMPFSQGQW